MLTCYILAFPILIMGKKQCRLEERLFTMLVIFASEVQFHVALVCAASLLQAVQAVAIIGILLRPNSNIINKAMAIAIVK